MPTPPKPYKVIAGEKRSHRTKAEIEQRKKAEEALVSGEALKERKATKNDKIAHKEFLRINKFLKKIEKNDTLYEAVINRYCIIQAESEKLENERAMLVEILEETNESFKKAKKKTEDGMEMMELCAKFIETAAKLYSNIGGIDKVLLQKRKMLLDIEKENVMTIASALRSIPKKEEKASNPLLEALKNG